MAARPQSGGGGGLSARDLLIAAASSGGAAVIVSYFWEAGTVMAAAITPVIVSLLREAVLPKALDRPARALSEVRTAHRPTGAPAAAGAGYPRSPAAGTGSTAAEAAPQTERLPATEPGIEDLDRETPEPEEAPALDRETQRLDPSTRRLDEQARPPEHETEPLAGPPPVGHGLPPRSERTGEGYGHAGLGRDGSRSRAPVRSPAAPGPARPPSSAPRRLSGAARRARVRLAVITGLLGFLIAAIVLTVPELVAGESVGGGEGRTTLFSPRGGESQQGDGAEDRVTDGDDSESPGGDGDGDGDDAGLPTDDDGSSEPDEPSSESQQSRRSIAPRERSKQTEGDESGAAPGSSGASRRSSGQRAPAQRTAPSRPSGGGERAAP